MVSKTIFLACAGNCVIERYHRVFPEAKDYSQVQFSLQKSDFFFILKRIRMYDILNQIEFCWLIFND